jgi:hypothetical protein
VHRVYRIVFDGSELQIWRDEPGFAQGFTAMFSADGSTLNGVWVLNQDNQAFATTSRLRPGDRHNG